MEARQVGRNVKALIGPDTLRWGSIASVELFQAEMNLISAIGPHLPP